MTEEEIDIASRKFVDRVYKIDPDAPITLDEFYEDYVAKHNKLCVRKRKGINLDKYHD